MHLQQFCILSFIEFIVSLSHEMLCADFHRGHRSLARGEMLSPSRLFLLPSFPISSILPEGAALPSVAVLERRYGGKVLLNSHNVQPLFQICKKTAQRVEREREGGEQHGKVNARITETV